MRRHRPGRARWRSVRARGSTGARRAALRSTTDRRRNRETQSRPLTTRSELQLRQLKTTCDLPTSWYEDGRDLLGERRYRRNGTGRKQMAGSARTNNVEDWTGMTLERDIPTDCWKHLRFCLFLRGRVATLHFTEEICSSHE